MKVKGTEFGKCVKYYPDKKTFCEFDFGEIIKITEREHDEGGIYYNHLVRCFKCGYENHVSILNGKLKEVEREVLVPFPFQ